MSTRKRKRGVVEAHADYVPPPSDSSGAGIESQPAIHDVSILHPPPALVQSDAHTQDSQDGDMAATSDAEGF